MDRRRFLLTSLASALAAPLGGEAQARKPVRVGFLSSFPNNPLVGRLQEALRARKWVEGRDFVLDIRVTDQDPERANALAKDLVQQRSDIIVTVNTAHALAAKKATASIPIVMYTSGFPVEAGVVTSLARPGGNVTGLSIYAGGQLFGKYVELLREAAPRLRQLAVLWDYAGPAFAEKEIDVAVRELRRGAQALHVNVNIRMVRTDGDVTEALASVANSSPDALFATGGPIHNRRENAPRIANCAIRHRLPMLNEFRGLLFESGGLLLYAVDPQDLANRTAHFIERISGGARPAELPIEQPSRFDLIINLKTAKALGLTSPPSLLARADQIIE